MGYTREEFLQLRPVDLDDPESTLDTPEVMDHLARDGRVVFDRATEQVEEDEFQALYDLNGV